MKEYEYVGSIDALLGFGFVYTTGTRYCKYHTQYLPENKHANSKGNVTTVLNIDFKSFIPPECTNYTPEYDSNVDRCSNCKNRKKHQCNIYGKENVLYHASMKCYYINDVDEEHQIIDTYFLNELEGYYKEITNE